MKEIKIKSANEVIYTFNAPTGLPVYMWINKDKTNVHMSLNVKYGSVGTDFTCNNIKYHVPTGTAHFLEHIKFYMKDANATELLYDLGCDSNAYTSLNETSFEVYANTNINEAACVLLDFVYDNYFTKKMVDAERKIILEECNSGKDDPEYDFFRKCTLSYFQKSNHRNPVIGYEKDINEITVDDVSLVHDFFYRPENMFMVITGNFDPLELEKVICENEKDRTFKDIGKVKITNPKEPRKFLENNIILESDKCSNTHAKYAIKSLLSDFKGLTKNEVLVALRCIISSNFGIASDFYEDIIQNGKATALRSTVSFDDGIVGINFNITSDNPDEVFKLIDEKLKKLELTKDDINRAKKNYKTTSIMRYDNIYSVSSYIIASIIDNGVLDDSRYDILNKLTIKKINDIYKCVDINNKMTAILKPSK